MMVTPNNNTITERSISLTIKTNAKYGQPRHKCYTPL